MFPLHFIYVSHNIHILTKKLGETNQFPLRVTPERSVHEEDVDHRDIFPQIVKGYFGHILIAYSKQCRVPQISHRQLPSEAELITTRQTLVAGESLIILFLDRHPNSLIAHRVLATTNLHFLIHFRHVVQNTTTVIRDENRLAFHFTVLLRVGTKVGEISLAREITLPLLDRHTADEL